MAKARSKGDVYWYAYKRKKPIAYSTVATSNTLALLAEKIPQVSPNNLLNYIKTSGLIGLQEEIAILQKYVEIGQGDQTITLKYN